MIQLACFTWGTDTILQHKPLGSRQTCSLQHYQAIRPKRQHRNRAGHTVETACSTGPTVAWLRKLRFASWNIAPVFRGYQLLCGHIKLTSPDGFSPYFPGLRKVNFLTWDKRKVSCGSPRSSVPFQEDPHCWRSTLPARPSMGDTRAGDPKEKNSGSGEIIHDDIKHDFWMKYFAKPKSSRQKAHASKSSQISESSHHLRHLWIQVQQKYTWLFWYKTADRTPYGCHVLMARMLWSPNSLAWIFKRRAKFCYKNQGHTFNLNWILTFYTLFLCIE